MKTVELLKTYLSAIGIDEYKISEAQDTIGYLITVSIPADNPKVGILKGRKGRNLRILKQILRIVGLNEKINPFLIIKLEETPNETSK